VYKFKRLDTDEIVEVDFEKMIEQDAAGYIKMKIDGKTVELRRVLDKASKSSIKEEKAGGPKIVSDSAGFHCAQLQTFEELRIKHGLTGIEHKPDPQVPGFIQVHASSEKEYNKYLKARGMYNASGNNGGRRAMSPKDLEYAKKLAIEKYGIPKKTKMPVDAG
jgi:hypothetical protein